VNADPLESEIYISHMLAAAVFLAQAAVLGTTYLGTPTLLLEMNEVARRYGWRFGFLTLGLCFVPYLHPGLGIAILVVSLLVSASNARQAWLPRVLGEAEYLALLRSAAAHSGPRPIIAGYVASGVLLSSMSLILWGFSLSDSWAWYFALGFLGYGAGTAFHGSIFAIRISGPHDETPAVSHTVAADVAR
jgi:hypothetical protein